MAEYKISSRIEADTRKFKREIRQAAEIAKQFKRDTDDIEPKIDADTSALRRSIKQAKGILNSFKKERAEAKADVDTKGAIVQINRIKLMFRSIPNKIRTKVVVDYDRGVFNAIRGGWNNVQNAQNLFQNRMDSLANAIRSFGTVISNQLKGGLIASFSAAIPIIAGLVPAIMAVGNAIGALTGGAIGLLGAFGILGGGVLSFGALAVSAITMLNDELLESTKATERYSKALDTIKSTWSDLVVSNADNIFKTMANGIETATVALNKMNPFISQTISSMERASVKLLDWANNSKTAETFFSNMGTTGVRIFDNMLNALGRFGSGFLKMFNSFMPLFDWVAQGFSNMGASFDEWASKVSTNKGIDTFIQGVKTNLPLVGQIFGNTFKGIFNLFRAFGDNSTTIFESLATMSAKFAEWSANISKSDGFQKFVQYVQTNGPVIMSLIGAITMALVNFGVAMAPIGQKVLGLVTAFTQWVAKLFETHPAIARILGVTISLFGVFMMLLPTIIQLGTFFTQLIIPLFNFVGIATRVASIVKFVGIALIGLNPIVLIIIAVIGTLVAIFTHLWQTNEGFRNAVITIWESIKAFFIATIEIIKQALISGFLTMVNTGIQIFNTLQTGLAAIWGVIKALISSSISIIVSVVSSGFSRVLSFVTSTMSSVLSFISSTFSSIVSTISSSISTAVSVVATGFSNMISAVVSFTSQLISNIVSAMSSFVSAITSGGSQALSAITSALNNMVSAARGFVGDMVSAGGDLIRGMIDGIKNMAGSLVSAAKGVVGDAVAGAKSLLGIHSPSRVFKEIGMYTAMGMTVGLAQEGRNTVRETANLANSVVNAFKPDLNVPTLNGSAISGNIKNLQGQIGTELKNNVDINASPQTIVIRIEGDRDLFRTYVNEQNAIDDSLAF